MWCTLHYNKSVNTHHIPMRRASLQKHDEGFKTKWRTGIVKQIKLAYNKNCIGKQLFVPFLNSNWVNP